MLKKIEKLSLENEKSLEQIGLKLSEETGEVTQALLSATNAPGSKYKSEDIEDVKEECVDVVMVALSLYFKIGGTTEELENTLKIKTNKWEKVSSIK